MNKKDLKYLIEEEKKKIIIESDSEFKIEKSKTLAFHFNNIYKKEDKTQDIKDMLFWRFSVISDKTIDRYIVRDCDSVISFKEAKAVIRG
ncbi:MAG: hypothetical protein GY932_05970 [Arcobacter sp.]|nr:hypothetical protein [Arcobacter sp.]